MKVRADMKEHLLNSITVGYRLKLLTMINPKKPDSIANQLIKMSVNKNKKMKSNLVCLKL